MNLPELISYNFSNVEWGWRIVTVLSKKIGLSFSEFAMILSCFQMLMLWRFLSRYCKNKMFALFLCYHTLYLTYYFSALRQAFVISVFLGIMLQWLIDGKYIRYCVLTVLCGTIHTVGFMMILPVLFRCINLKVSHLIALVGVGFSFGIIFSIFGVGQILQALGIGGSATSYMGETDISVIAVAERILSYFFISYLYYIYSDGKEPDQNDRMLIIFKIYSLSVLLYAVLLWSPLISSRTTYLFKILEIALFSTCIIRSGKARNLVMCYTIALCTLLYYKNIGSYIYQGHYTNCSTLTYPYVSIFNKEDIAAYRLDTGRYIYWLDLDVDPEYAWHLQQVYETEVASLEE